jgi:hypothetical protein
MKQTTLISLYGEKRSDFATLIECCQNSARKVLGGVFTPYGSTQIHGTIFGLERKLGSPLRNANFAKYRSRDVLMALDGILNYLRTCGHIPLEIQIGGYGNREYPFTSRNVIPYERSFSIQGDKVVMMGWLCEAIRFSYCLQLRVAGFKRQVCIRAPLTSSATLRRVSAFCTGIIEG